MWLILPHSLLCSSFYHLHWIFCKWFRFLLLKVLSLCNREAWCNCPPHKPKQWYLHHCVWESEGSVWKAGRLVCVCMCATLHLVSFVLSSCLCGFLGFLSVFKWACVSNTYIYRGTSRHSQVCWVSQTHWNLLFIWPGVAQVRCSSLGTSRHWPLDSRHKYL